MARSKVARRESGTKRAPKAEAAKVARMGRQGRLVIPAEVRASLGVREGDGVEFVAVDPETGTVTLKVQRSHEIFEEMRRTLRAATGGKDVVGDLIKERRANAKRE